MLYSINVTGLCLVVVIGRVMAESLQFPVVELLLISHLRLSENGQLESTSDMFHNMLS